MNKLIGLLLGISVMGLVEGARAQSVDPVYELAFELAEVRCDMAADGWIEDGLTEEQVGGPQGMYEACMRLSVPPMVLSPAQHYDTTDGAFWSYWRDHQ